MELGGEMFKEIGDNFNPRDTFRLKILLVHDLLKPALNLVCFVTNNRLMLNVLVRLSILTQLIRLS